MGDTTIQGYMVKKAPLPGVNMDEVRALWWHQGVVQYASDYAQRMLKVDAKYMPSALGGVVTHNLLWVLYLTNLQQALGHHRTLAYPRTKQRLNQLLVDATSEQQRVTEREVNLSTITELYGLYGNNPWRLEELRNRIAMFYPSRSLL